MTEEYRTKSGRILTEEEIEKLADEAERGYDVSRMIAAIQTDSGMQAASQWYQAAIADGWRCFVDGSEIETFEHFAVAVTPSVMTDGPVTKHVEWKRT